MDKAELKRRWKAHIAGMRRAEERVIRERRRSTPTERIRQAEIWFDLGAGLGGTNDKEEEEVRRIWTRIRKAWAALHCAEARAAHDRG